MTNRLTAEDLAAIRQRHRIGVPARDKIDRLLSEVDALITERDSVRLQLASCQEALQEVVAELRQVGTNLGGADNTRPAVDLAAEARLALDLNETVQKQLIAERDSALARLEEYRRPEHWPEGSQMRHVRDLEVVLAVSHRREAEADKELARLRSACAAQSHVIEQTLGRVLGYPRYVDDPEHFPGATEAEGVCVADQTAESLADEAAAELVRLQPVVAAARGWACQTDVYLAACNRDTEVGWQEEGRRLDAAVTVLRAALNAADKEASGGAD